MGIETTDSRYDVDETTVVKSWLSLEEQEFTQSVLAYCLSMFEHKVQALKAVQP
jgi:hypothetical protein